ncbi:hypothetical protein OE88DRAFT_1730081 [Heliocybe sulcata]|uniref:Uncharacterized protein n=1 Tax=Heliocybe sulcata TaxID=5364 RepID=A0A5C3NFD7_9AGAM|nr:hypothetical protein OE88DRAFT_1730081 [Heliocybe sulcata]
MYNPVARLLGFTKETSSSKSTNVPSRRVTAPIASSFEDIAIENLPRITPTGESKADAPLFPTPKGAGSSIFARRSSQRQRKTDPSIFADPPHTTTSLQPNLHFERPSEGAPAERPSQASKSPFHRSSEAESRWKRREEAQSVSQMAPAAPGRLPQQRSDKPTSVLAVQVEESTSEEPSQEAAKGTEEEGERELKNAVENVPRITPPGPPIGERKPDPRLRPTLKGAGSSTLASRLMERQQEGGRPKSTTGKRPVPTAVRTIKGYGSSTLASRLMERQQEGGRSKCTAGKRPVPTAVRTIK